MRSLATINSGACPPPLGTPWTPARSYISRTFPLAIRGRSASEVVTCGDASERSGDRMAARCGVLDVVEPREDLARVAGVVGVVEDRVQVEPGGALVPLPQTP